MLKFRAVYGLLRRPARLSLDVRWPGYFPHFSSNPSVTDKPSIAVVHPALYARFPRRLQALVLDAGLLVVVLILGAAAAGAIAHERASQAVVLSVLAAIVLYDPLFVSRTGGTLGHHVLNMRVVDENCGSHLPFLRAFLRFMVKAPLGLFSFVFMALTRRHQALHDVIAGSTVQLKDPRTAHAVHYVSERADELEVAGTVSAFRRILVCIAYVAAAYTGSTFVALFLVSGECIMSDLCTPRDEAVFAVIGVVWIAVAAGIVVLGWRARLPGARSTSVPVQGAGISAT
jgi:uncharacterized RDD family membrane protein YckC